MGRLLMSHRLAQYERGVPNGVPAPLLDASLASPEPEIVYWSASNAFDPDSEEFWASQEVVYEAFLDEATSVNDVRASTPTSEDERASPAPSTIILEENRMVTTTTDRATGTIFSQEATVDGSLVPTRPSTPDNGTSSLDFYPESLLRTPPMAQPSPPPSVTPHIYTWDSAHTLREYHPSMSPANTTSTRRLRSRLMADPRTPTHRRRESLPASIPLMG